MTARKARLDAAIAGSEFLLFDGALGTELIERGLGRGDCPELWNLERAEVLRGIARDYAEAGADVVTSNSFGANEVKLGSHGLADRSDEISRAATRLVREAVGEEILVAGSMGPTGAFLEPLGPLTREACFACYARQARALAEGGADLILVETMTAVDEARIALDAAREATELPVGVTMTFDPSPRGWYTIMGVSPAECVAELASADFLGTNCGNGMEGVIEIIAALRAETTRPLLAQANAGVPRLVNGKAAYPEGPAEMTRSLDALLKAGATFVGGCCGTGPSTIASFRRWVKGDTP